MNPPGEEYGPDRRGGTAARARGILHAVARRVSASGQGGTRRFALWGTAATALALVAVFAFAGDEVFEAGNTTGRAAANVASLASMWMLAVWTAYMVPPDRSSRLQVLAAGSLAVVAALGIRTSLLALPAPPGSALSALVAAARVTAADTVMLMGLLLIGGLALAVYPGVRRNALDQAWRELQVRQGRLSSLTGQIRPHFAGNALNCVAGLLLTDVTAARTTLRRLRSVISRTSRYSDVQEIRLHEELALVRDYVAIEQARFQDRLTVHFDIQPETLDAYIPSLVLQPLVENAIVHGTMRRTGCGDIHVRAELHDDELHLVVEDGGPGLPRRNLVRGVGSSVTQDRLSSLHPGASRLTLGERLEGGTRARVFLPYITTPSLQRAKPGEAKENVRDAVEAAADMRTLDLRAGAVTLWVVVAGLYAWQYAGIHGAGGSQAAVAVGVGVLAATGGAAVSLLAYHLGRTTPLERGQRVHGFLAAALVLAPPFVLYWRTMLRHLWAGAGSSGMRVAEGMEVVALAVGIMHVMFAGYVVHQQTAVVARAELIRSQRKDLTEAERRQQNLAVSDAELDAGFEAIEAALDEDPEVARGKMADLMTRLRRAAENRA